MRVLLGDLFESQALTLVNTVNCVGVMGKGIAKTFKEKYPNMFKEYVSLCNEGKVKPGRPYLYKDLCGRSVLNFPTKDHWRSPSKLSYIVSGLEWFRENYENLGILSIAFPPLGCGNGGLEWSTVGPIMFQKLKDLPIEIELYAPYGTPKQQVSVEYLEKCNEQLLNEQIGQKQESINKYWLLILYVIQKLNNDKYSLSVGRTIFQKICYVLTRTGLPMGFTFQKASYGPYAVDVKNAITVLSNANLMSERTLGKMVETVVSPSFILDRTMYTEDEIAKADRSYDLLSRIKSTDHAEMITTVLFAFDELNRNSGTVTGRQVLDYILEWKPHWKDEKEQAIINTIIGLSSLGWISPIQLSDSLFSDDEIY